MGVAGARKKKGEKMGRQGGPWEGEPKVRSYESDIRKHAALHANLYVCMTRESVGTVWWCAPVILVLRGLTRDYCETKASLDYRVKL